MTRMRIETENERLQRELSEIQNTRKLAKERRALKRAILANKIGRATDIMGEIGHNAKTIAQRAGHVASEVNREAVKAYSPQNRAKMRNVRRQIFGE